MLNPSAAYRSGPPSEEKSGERTKTLIFELRVAAPRGPLNSAFRGWMPCDGERRSART